MKITEHSVPSCGIAEQATSKDEALQRRIAEKSKEFIKSGAEVYPKA